MANPDRLDRIKQLKVNAKRNEVIVALSEIVLITPNNFLSIEETVEFSKKVYEKVDASLEQITLKKDFEENLSYLGYIAEKTNFFLDKDVVVLHQQDRESGAFVIKLRLFWSRLQKMLKFIGFQDGYRDLVVVSTNLDFGICIERHEYQNNVVFWYN